MSETPKGLDCFDPELIIMFANFLDFWSQLSFAFVSEKIRKIVSTNNLIWHRILRKYKQAHLLDSIRGRISYKMDVLDKAYDEKDIEAMKFCARWMVRNIEEASKNGIFYYECYIRGACKCLSWAHPGSC